MLSSPADTPLSDSATISSSNPARAQAIRTRKNGPPVAALTAYDYPTGRLLDESGIDLILVGDSLGMVVYGHPDTTSVTLADMVRHTQAVRRGVRQACLVADLPAGTYLTPSQALASARDLVAAGADAVKLEGGLAILPQIELILAKGIPVVGHLGMLPQHVVEEGGYRRKGKLPAEADALLADAAALDQAGVSAIVLESIVASLADAITLSVRCPTIGIGSGPSTDGQIRVIHDLIGAFPWFRPPFAECYHDTSALVRDAAQRFRDSLTPPQPS